MRTSPFFSGIAQTDVTIAGQPARMPVFFRDGTGLTAVFPARLGAIAKLIPDPAMTPSRFMPGVGLIAISAFEYRRSDVGRYNEVAISVILKDPAVRGNAPAQGVIQALRRMQFHSYVHHLPVTTEIACELGRGFYSLPKFIATVEFAFEPGHFSCRLASDGDQILTLHAARLSGGSEREVELVSHQWMNRHPQSASFDFHAMPLATTTRPATARLELGRLHPIALELERLLLAKRSIHHQQMERFEAVLRLPAVLPAALARAGQSPDRRPGEDRDP